MISRGNLLIDTIFGLNVTPPASIVTSAATAGNYTVQGLQVGDLVQPYFTSAVTNISMVNAWVSAANTLTIYFSSETGSTVSSAPAVNIVVNLQRYEQTAFSQLPTNAL
jgi:hypothetical protein